MKTASEILTRRDFLQASAAVVVATAAGSPSGALNPAAADDSFSSMQERRRKELWGLLGDLPWKHHPCPPRVVT